MKTDVCPQWEVTVNGCEALAVTSHVDDENVLELQVVTVQPCERINTHNSMLLNGGFDGV